MHCVNRRLLFVHAHPDDESSQSAGTIARYCADGAQVTLVTCTLGERGEILVPELEHLSEEELGAHRIAELTQAMSYVGLEDHVFLGGAGRYHDTGMDRSPEGAVIVPGITPGNAFWHADLLEAANFLVEIIRDRKPQVVSTYNPFGGYGHPDHIQAHRVATYAVALAGTPSHRPDLGEPWCVQRVVWSVYNTMMWKKAYPLAKQELPELFDGQDRDPETFGPPEKDIACVVPFGEFYDVTRKALGAHKSQVNMDDVFWRFHGIVNQMEGSGEAYAFASGVPFPPSKRTHDDLFAGLEL